MPICTMRSALDMVSACASVLATTKSTPCRPAVIMLLTALPPAPPTPNTVMRGFISRMSGIFRLMLILCLSCALRSATGTRDVSSWSEALAQPAPDLSHVAARTRHQLPRSPRFEMFEMRRLRVNQQSRRDREGRPFRRIRQSGKAERTPDPYRPLENFRREIGEPDQLACAAGEHDARARLSRKGRARESIAHHFEDFLNARLDHVHD